jgi:hypothetical protein
MHFIDSSEDLFSQPLYELPTAATDAQVEAIAAAYQAASQSSLWKISDTFEYVGPALASNADAGLRFQASQGINILFKAGNDSVTLRIPSPIPATMEGTSDIVDPTAAELTAFNTAVEAAITGYTAQSAQFTGRKDRKNTRVGF